MNDFYNFKFWQLYLIIALFCLAITYITNSYIFTNSFYYAAFSDKFDINKITKIIALQNKYQYVDYLILPIILLLKLWIIAGVIFTGLYLIKREIKYKDCLKIAILAELVSVVVMLIRVVWLLIQKPMSMNDIQYFSPLSIAQLINFNTVPKYLFYPLQLFNVFEVAYWLVLAYGIMAFTNFKFGKSLKVVASSYGVALAVWAIIVVFIQVQFS